MFQTAAVYQYRKMNGWYFHRYLMSRLNHMSRGTEFFTEKDDFLKKEIDFNLFILQYSLVRLKQQQNGTVGCTFILFVHCDYLFIYHATLLCKRSLEMSAFFCVAGWCSGSITIHISLRTWVPILLGA